MAHPRKLEPRQQRFVVEYLLDLNAKQAAIRAGYSEKTAESQGSRLLSYAKVSAAIADAQARRAARVEIKADDILLELLRLAKSDVRQLFDETGRLKPIHEMSDTAAASLASVEILREKTTVQGEITIEESVRKIRLWDKTAALTTLAKHLGLLKERIVHEGDIPLTFTINVGDARGRE